MRDRILDTLREIEATDGVKIPFAIESGSRAWGFASPDSDWDVRFVYVRPRDHYLSIAVEHERDVIERPITDELDVSGWDLRKALGLLRKSNPPLLEWLGSPIVYRDDGELAPAMRALAAATFSRRGCAWHYLRMAQSNERSHLRGDDGVMKKYLYVLRPLLALRWLHTRDDVVPTPFAELVDACVDDPAVRDAIERLVAAKRDATETARQPHDPTLRAFIRTELAAHEEAGFALDTGQSALPPFDDLFRQTLERLS